MNASSSTHQLTYGLIALCTALTLHAAGLVWLKTIDLSPVLNHWHATMGHHSPLVIDPVQGEELIAKRNQQLAEAFQQLSLLPVREVAAAKDDIAMLSIEFTDLDFHDTGFTSLLPEAMHRDWEINEMAVPDAQEFLTGTESKVSLFNQASNARQELAPSEFKPSAKELLQPEHGHLARELNRVTEQFPSQPVNSALGQIGIKTAHTQVQLETPLMAGSIASRGSEQELESHLSANESSPPGGSLGSLPNQNPVPKGTGQLFLPQVHKRPKEMVICSLPMPHPKLVQRSVASEDSILSSQFNLLVDYTPKTDGEGYLFRLQLQPVTQASLPHLHRNLYFFIDRTQSISPQHYELSKQAVAHALRYMQEGDSFNILIFDQQVTMLAPYNLPWTNEYRRQAELFLNNQPYTKPTVATDIYTALSTIAPQEAKQDEINIAILLSDGNTSLNQEQQRRVLSKWTQRNSGKLILYAIALPQSSYLALLESLCTFNHGKMYITPSMNALNQTLAGLVKALQPVAKDVVVSVVPSDEQQLIALSPPNSRLPLLLEKLPFVLYGSNNRIDDFYIFIQGRYYGKRLDMKHKVSLAAAKVGDAAALERAWALQKAQVYYERYLREGKRQYVTLAQNLLSPHQLPAAFQ